MKKKFKYIGEKNKTLISGAFAMLVLLSVALGCTCFNKSQPPPPEYVGAWTSADGAILKIRADGSGDYESGGTSVSNGSVEVKNDELSVKLMGIGKTFKIDEPPGDNRMKLDGVVFTKNGDANTISEKTPSDDRNNVDDPAKTSAPPDASTGEVPDEAQLQAMAKETMLDFNDAIQDEDFSGFYDNISKVWQKETSPEDLEKGFKVFMDKNADFSQIRKLEADITETPKIKRELGYKMLNLSGVYDTSPLPTKFDLKYVPQGKDWKLSYIRVSTKPN